MRLIVSINELANKNFVALNDISINFMIISGTNEFTIFGLFRLAGINAVYSTLGTVVFERIYATVYLENYEKTVSNPFFFYCILYHTLEYCIATYSIYKEWIDLAIFGTVIILLNIIGYFMFTGLEWFNERRYRTSLMHRKKYTLSERFQLQENIRTAHLMKSVAGVFVFLNILVGISMIISSVYIDEFAKRISYVVFNFALSFTGYTFPLLGMGKNRMWSQIFLRLKKWTKIAPSNLPEILSQAEQRAQLSNQIRGFNGTKIIFTIDEERELYFNNLKNHWNK
uniref:Gustatory receptor n=1 Tax=Panagrolaimus sp. PS1159 TaxID=55785 RepID=A0AC35GVF8_9BILA